MPGERDNDQGYRGAEEVRRSSMLLMVSMRLTGTGRIRTKSRRMRCIRWRICNDLLALTLDTDEVEDQMQHTVPSLTSTHYQPSLFAAENP